jgi:hypothetical protein
MERPYKLSAIQLAALAAPRGQALWPSSPVFSLADALIYNPAFITAQGGFRQRGSSAIAGSEMGWTLFLELPADGKFTAVLLIEKLRVTDSTMSR